MKSLTQKVKQAFKSAFKSESAQGATEYILLLVVVVGIAVAFGPEIKKAVTTKMGELTSSLGAFKG